MTQRLFGFLLAALLSNSVLALDSPPPPDPNRSDNETRDIQVYDALVGSNPDQDFSLYRLNYAIANDEDLLLQYSFKYRVLGELYLAYTNLVLWDIYHAEQPAIDNNFMPELFYRFLIYKPWLTSVDAGWFHRSNGREGPTSRAWDRWQVRFNTDFKWRHMDVIWQTAFNSDIKKSSKNKDINDYYGPWESGLTFRNLLGNHQNQLDLLVGLVAGEDGYRFNTGQKTVGLHYRMRWAKFKPTLYLRYFNGYGEVIQNYNIKTESLRFGLSFHY
ncbi:outer membrane phospholipase A [Alteromonadaceae bacterium 2753L.S.0a.02]|nr:outer membrane phospholipase A [Alteromonadaceae bacterium 2753L.S.0a.02]